MPYASEFVWSLGLLNIHSKEYVDVQLDSTNSSKHCLNLTVGETDSDTVIGYAVGNMTKQIAMKDIRCNTSRWCYTKKVSSYKKYSTSLGINFFPASPTLEYICCEYKNNESKMSVECSQKHGYDSVCWNIHQELGTLMWLYS